MTLRGILAIAFVALAIFWLSQRAEKIATLEEEEAVVTTNSPHPNPLPIQGEGEDEEVIKPDTPPYEGEVGPANAGTGEVKSAAVSSVLVTRVIDGDTIQLQDGRPVRYIGIDAPETRDCFAPEATTKNRQLVEGKLVHLEKDISETDKYGRLVRYVYVGNTFINDLLVREGYAKSYPFPPDVAFRDQLRQAQAEAKSQQKGLWKACN